MITYEKNVNFRAKLIGLLFFFPDQMLTWYNVSDFNFNNLIYYIVRNRKNMEHTLRRHITAIT